MITYLQPDILECEVKQALGSITTNKANGGDGIPAELFQILKDDAVKVSHSICQQIWETLVAVAIDWKRSVFIPIPKKWNAKGCSYYGTIALKLGFNNTRTENFQMFKLDLEKAQLRDQIANIPWIKGIAREFHKNIYFCSLTMLKPFTVFISTNCGKFLKRWEYQTTLPAFWEICIQVKKQQLELDMEQWTGSKLGKEYVKACQVLSLCLFNLCAEYIVQNAKPDKEAQAQKKISGRNINNLRYAEDITLMAESKEELKSLLMKVKDESKKELV